MKKFRIASEQTLVKVVVNLKVYGYPGRVLRPFTMWEREKIFNELERREWIDKNGNLLPKSQEIIMKNLSLADTH